MKRGRLSAHGFTIVETLIFLAVTGALFLMAMLLIGGQQRKTQFSVDVRQFAAVLEDISNDVSNGFYAAPPNFSCTDNGIAGQRPSFDPAGTNQIGANKGCIFVGRVIQFSPDGQPDKYKVATIVGKQRVGSEDTQNFDQAKPTALAFSSDVPADADRSEIKSLGGGLRFAWVRYNGSIDRGILGFFSTFPDPPTSDGKVSGANRARLLIPNGTSVGQGSAIGMDKINAMSEATGNFVAPSGGIKICIDDGSEEHAIISLGGSQSSAGVEVQVSPGSGCP